MARLPFLLVLGILCSAPTAQSHDLETPTRDQEIYFSRIAYEAAVLDLHRYRFVEHPRAVRALEHRIRVRRAEIVLLQRRIEEWEPFNRWRTGQILPLSVELARQAIEEREYELEELESELFDSHRLRIETIRHLQAQVNQRGEELRSVEAMAKSAR